MANEVISAKAEIIERGLHQIDEEYGGRSENLHENWTKQDSILLNLERACQASIDLALVENLLREGWQDFRQRVALALKLEP